MVHGIRRIRQAKYKFDVAGVGVQGASLTLDIRRVCKPTEPEYGVALLRFTLIKRSTLGFPGYQVSVSRHGAGDVARATFEPFLRGMRVASMWSAAAPGSIEEYRDRALVAAVMDAFYLRSIRYSVEDAVNALTHHLALACGIKADTLSSVWVHADPGFQDESNRIVRNLRDEIDRVLGAQATNVT